MALVTMNGRKAFIDASGQTIISKNFRYASSFSGGLAHFETMT
jgi:hypothetical protein